SHADFLIAHWRGIALTFLSPIYLHAVGPGRDAIVPPKGIPEVGSRLDIEIRPTPHARVGAIGSYNPPGANPTLPNQDIVAGNSGDYALPQQVDSQPTRTF